MRFLCDVDGIISNFVGTVARTILAETGREFSPREFKTWRFIDALPIKEDEKKRIIDAISSPGYARAIDAFEGAVESVKEIADLFDENLYFVTQPWEFGDTWHSDREWWLEHHFGKLGKNVIHTKHKHTISGTILLDDRPSHIEKWVPEQKGLGILFTRPSNEEWANHNIRWARANNWKDVMMNTRAERFGMKLDNLASIRNTATGNAF